MVPSDFQLKAMNAVHRTLLTVSFGRFGWKAGKMPVLQLTTTGSKSGKPHAVMLTSPVQEDDTVVVVASKGGRDHHPAWFLNLQANGDVEVAYKGGPKQPMKATVASSEERERLWPEVTKAYKGYAGYQEQTDREIPLVLLTPAG